MKPNSRWILSVSLWIAAAALVIVLVTGSLDEPIADLLYRVGLIYAEPMTGLE
jgi:hypothetical protein